MPEVESLRLDGIIAICRICGIQLSGNVDSDNPLQLHPHLICHNAPMMTGNQAVAGGSGGISITGISPTLGPAAGNTTITVTGSGFLVQNGQSSAAVRLGGKDCPTLSITNTQLSFRSPAGTSGVSVDLCIVDSASLPIGGLGAALASAFFYQ